MATGRLATFQVGSSNTTLYTVPTGYYAIANVSITNQNTSSITLKIFTQINSIIFIIDIFVNFFVAFRKPNF
jgi:hypothetical protein